MLPSVTRTTIILKPQVKSYLHSSVVVHEVNGHVLAQPARGAHCGRQPPLHLIPHEYELTRFQRHACLRPRPQSKSKSTLPFASSLSVTVSPPGVPIAAAAVPWSGELNTSSNNSVVCGVFLLRSRYTHWCLLGTQRPLFPSKATHVSVLPLTAVVDVCSSAFENPNTF